MKKILAIAPVALFLATHVTVNAITLYPQPAMADCQVQC
jgi:hypothetical protein